MTEPQPNNSQPRIGIGVILVNAKGQIVQGRRKSSHAPYWSIPGGHLELGESFEACAIREVAEETGLLISTPRVIAVNNDLVTFAEYGKHYVSVTLLAEPVGGEPRLLEPDKCEGWHWVDPHQLPEPQFTASRQAVACWLAGISYLRESQLEPELYRPHKIPRELSPDSFD